GAGKHPRLRAWLTAAPGECPRARPGRGLRRLSARRTCSSRGSARRTCSYRGSARRSVRGHSPWRESSSCPDPLVPPLPESGEAPPEELPSSSSSDADEDQDEDDEEDEEEEEYDDSYAES